MSPNYVVNLKLKRLNVVFQTDVRKPTSALRLFWLVKGLKYRRLCHFIRSLENILPLFHFVYSLEGLNIVFDNNPSLLYEIKIKVLNNFFEVDSFILYNPGRTKNIDDHTALLLTCIIHIIGMTIQLTTLAVTKKYF